MASTSTAPPLRQSCDRCHRQKLRCTRASGRNAGACNRCLRKRVQCVYSVSLPKGRPSIYRLADEPNDTAAGMVTPYSTAGSAASLSRSGDDSAIGDGDGDSDVDVDVGVGGHVRINPDPDPEAAADANVNVNVDMDSHRNTDGDTYDSVNAGTDGPTNTSRDACINDKFDSRFMNPPMDMAASAWLWPRDFTELDIQTDWRQDQPTLHRQPILDPRLDVDMTSFEFFASVGRDGGHDRHTAPDQPPPPSIAKMMDMLDNRERLTTPNSRDVRSENATDIGLGADGNSSSGDTAVLKSEDADLVIAQLTQLSIRLSSLRLSSYALARAAESSFPSTNDSQAPRRKLLDDVAFDSVASWLAREANGCAKLLTLSSSMSPGYDCTYPKSVGTGTRSRGTLLQDVLSSSHHLLEVLRYVQTSCNVDGSLSTPSRPSGSPAPSIRTQLVGIFATSDSVGETLDSSSCPFPSSYRSDDNIIRNLVTACHTLLLTIYQAMFAAIEHDACQPAGITNTAALGHIRLASIVQLCSYLTQRQQQAVGAYLKKERSHSPEMSFADPSCTTDSHQNFPPVSVMGDREAIIDLEMKVQHRLTHLQKILRF
ncbi:Zn(2)-C6 fungal-type DNA-binding domain protein [Metarhizium guizhouense ARSEF 977]|uniref:Zn(2)-C6 fungal-type DNA-binding domain protein n=1 Tax=Metarhizium guizhouense (strain ARSEF 977) TaxID=1276136 RepID=A0A0B4HYP5_METGA|nr:Zn(2)-C6 fungal-type DNA-binding domain protein [Metarhizium guizhouense ARSEF 977]